LAVIAEAEKKSSSDQIADLVGSLETVRLHTSPIQKVSGVTFGRSGVIAVLDGLAGKIYLYDRVAAYLGPLGEKGRGPGKYVSPRAVVASDANFSVVDFSDHRVSTFDPHGSFVSSFVYTAEKFSATGLFYNVATQSYYLFGNRWHQVNGLTTDDLVNVYRKDGQFVESIGSFPSVWSSYNLYPVDHPIVASSNTGEAFFMLSFAPVLHHITPLTLKVDDIPLSLPGFKSPTVGLPSDLRKLKNIHSWELGFTPIRALVMCREQIVVEYETDLGLRYTIAIFKAGESQPTRVIQTNFLIVGSDTNGEVALVQNPGRKDLIQNEYYLGHFAFAVRP